jgi:Zn-finger nucleic acid-binding protein
MTRARRHGAAFEPTEFWMDCPKCDSIMEEVTFHGITVERCTQCRGIWFAGIEYKELKKLKGSESIDVGSPKLGQEYDGMKDVHCPECDKIMDRISDKFQPHLHYEVCSRGHGAFFDAGEFKDFKEETLGDFIKDLSMHIKWKKK